MHRSTMVAAGAATIAVLAAAPAAAATSCGTAKGVKGATVTKIKTSSGKCSSARTVAKTHARTRTVPGWSCKERDLRARSGLYRASVRCRRAGRTVTFIVHWKTSLPLPPAEALPSPNAGSD